MQTIFKNHLEALILVICQFLRLENTCPKLFYLLFHAYAHLYPITFLYTNPIAFSLRYSNHNTLATLLRPYLLLQNVAQYQILIWILFLLQFAALALTFYATNKEINREQQIKRRKGHRLVFFCTLYLYILSTILYAPLLEILLIALALPTPAYLIVPIIFLATQYILIFLFADTFYNKGIVLYSHSLLPLNKSSHLYFIKTLTVLQILLYLFLNNASLARFLHATLIIAIQASHLIHLIDKKSYVDPDMVLLKVSLTSIGFMIALYTLLTHLITHQNLWILVMLPLTKLLYEFHFDCQCDLTKLDASHLKYLYAYFEINSLEDSGPKFRIQKIIMIHRKHCENQACICRVSIKDIKWCLTQLIMQRFEFFQNNKNVDQIETSLDYLTILTRSRQLVKAQKIIAKIQETSSAQKSLIKQTLFRFIQRIVRQSMTTQMRDKKVYTSLAGQQISSNLKQFALNEVTQLAIQRRFKALINRKGELYLKLSEHKSSSLKSLNHLYDLIEDLQRFKEILYERYLAFPTLGNQNTLKYFCVEVLNDFIEAFNLHQSNALEDEKYMLFSNQDFNRIFGVNPSYMVVEMEKEMEIYILRISKRAAEFFRAKHKDETITINNEKLEIYKFFPNYVKGMHKKLCERFLDQGINKFYQAQQQSYVTRRSNSMTSLDVHDSIIMIPIEMMMGLNHYSPNCIQFYCFFYESDDYKSIIVANTNFQIINCSENLFELLRGPNSSEKIYIDDIIPEFHNYIPESHHQNVRIRLLKEGCTQDSQGYQDFLTSISVTQKFKDDDTCYFVILEDLKKAVRRMNKAGCEFVPQAQSLNTLVKPLAVENFRAVELEMQEDIYKDVPYEDIKYPHYSYANFDSQAYLIQDIEQGPPLPINQSKTISPKKQHLLSPQNSLLNDGLLKNHETFIHGKNKISNFFKNNIETTSQVSSLTAIKRSKYYKKFETIYLLTHSISPSQKLRQMSGHYFLTVMLAVAYAIITLILILRTSRFIQDIKLLSIRCDVTEPYDSFLLTRYTVVSYNTLFNQRKITEAERAFLIKFPNSNLIDAYDHLKTQMYGVLQKPEIATITGQEQIAVHIYQSQNRGILQNVTFRTLASLLMNYQYEYKLALTIRTTQLDSAYFYFSFKNYLTIKRTFMALNEEILEQTKQRIAHESTFWIYVFAPFIFIFLVINCFMVYCYITFVREQMEISQQLLRIDPQYIEQEQTRVQGLIQCIDVDFDQVKDFFLDTDMIDQDIDRLFLKEQKVIKKTSKDAFTDKYSLYGISIQCLNFLFFLLFSIGIYLQMQTYFHKFLQTAIFYNKLANLNSDIPTAYAQKEVLYRRIPQYPFYTQEDTESLLNLFVTSVDEIEAYTKRYIKLDSDFLFDESTMRHYKAVHSENICNQVSEDFKDKSSELCPLVMEGNLQLGLHQCLIYITNSLRVEQIETKNFSQLRTPKLQLEGATIIINVLATLKEMMFDNLLGTTNSLILQQQVLCSLFLFIQMLGLFFYLTKLDRWNFQRYQCLKRMVYLFPRHTLMFDEQFYRRIRSYIRQEDL